VPNWRKQEYDIWYRDPEVVVRNMLANPDFEKEIDVAPYVELDVNGIRRRSDFMSANFAWRQCVRFFCSDLVLSKLMIF
jgi:Plavaka transposase